MPPPVPLAALTVPYAAARGATSVPRAAAVICAVLAACCLPLVVAGLVAEPLLAVGGVVGVLFWGGLGALAWRASRRAARRPLVGGAVIVAARPDGVALGPDVLWPYAALDAIALHWFAIERRPNVLGPGAAVADGLVEAAYAGAGGNLGLAVCLSPRDPSWLGAVPVGSGMPLSVVRDPAGRAMAVAKGHRLVTDGDLGVLAAALADAAARHGVPLSGAPVPPADGPPPLPDWLR